MHIKSFSLCILLAVSMPASAQLSVGIGLPGVSIGINLGAYPDLTPIPGYPVYYAPRTDANLFFYDGLYWAYSQDGWYSSDWYNGPWQALAIEAVPLFLLRVPVRYYRRPPVYFRDWREDAPPRWGERWGHDWERRHHGWDHWDNSRAPRLAPLPIYQRDYDRDRYPQGERQRQLRREHYDYQPREQTARQLYRRPAPASHRAAGRDRPDREGGRPSSQERAQLRPQEQLRVQDREHQERGPRHLDRRSEPVREAPPRKAIKLEQQQRPPARQARARQPAQIHPPEPQGARQREQARPQQAAQAPAVSAQNAQQRGRDNQQDRKRKHEQAGERGQRGER